DLRSAYVVDTDEAVAATVADEGDARAVRRPARVAVRAPRAEQRFGVVLVDRLAGTGVHRGAVDLAAARVDDPAAIGREREAVRAHPAPGLPAVRADRPDRALGATRIARWVGDPARAVRAVPSDERDDRAVVRDLRAGHVHAVIGHERREAHRPKIGRGG